jgi:hypothetical protein
MAGDLHRGSVLTVGTHNDEPFGFNSSDMLTMSRR